MAELKFLRGLLANLPEESGRTTDNFYVTTGASEGDYRLYLGKYLLAQGDVVERLVALETLMGGEGTGSVADQIQAAIGALDVTEIKSEGQAIVAVSETDGKISATAGDIAASHVTIADAEGKLDAATVEAALLELVTKLEAETVNRQNAIASLDATVGSQTISEGKHVAVEVVEVDGKLTALTVVENDIASAAVLADLKEDVDLFFKDADFAENAKDTLKELQEYISTDVAGAATMSQAIADNKTAIEAEAATARSAEEANAKAITAETAAREAAISAETAAREAAVSAETAAREAADNAINATIGDVESGTTVVEMIAAAKAAATTKVVEGDDGGNNLEVVRATSEEDGSVTYTINLTDVASATALDSEVSARTEAMNTEAARVDKKIADDIAAESTLRQAAEKANADAIAAEVTRATEAEADLQSQINDEATAREAADKAINDTIGTVDSGKTVVGMIADEVSARTTADEALDGRLDALEAVEVTGNDAIVVSANGATENKEVSLKLAPQPAEGEAGVVLSQDVNGLKATLQWGTF